MTTVHPVMVNLQRPCLAPLGSAQHGEIGSNGPSALPLVEVVYKPGRGSVRMGAVALVITNRLRSATPTSVLHGGTGNVGQTVLPLAAVGLRIEKENATMDTTVKGILWR